MSLTNPQDLLIAVPTFPIDRIIGTTSGSFSVSAPSASPGFTTNTATFVTGFGDTCYFQGIFSTDGGTTWNDLGVYQPDLTSPAAPVLQTVTCEAYMNGGTLTLVGKNWYDLVHSTSSAYTIQYKVFFIAKNTQGSLTPLTSSQKIFYSSAYNFQKIDFVGSFAVSTSASTTVSHNLGYVPKVRAWFVPTNATGGIEGIYTVPAGSMMTLDWFNASVQVNATNVVFSIVLDNSSPTVGIPGTMEYRVYLDS